MIQINRLYFLLLATDLLLMPLGASWLGWLDETVYAALLALAGLDCAVNGRWGSYRPVWVIFGIMAGYIAWGLAIQSNTPGMVVMDGLIESKPFVTFAVFLCGLDGFSDRQRGALKVIAAAMAAAVCVVLTGGHHWHKAVTGHSAYAGASMYIYAMVYLWVSAYGDGKLTRRDLLVTMMMLVAGLMCGRSKYYAEFMLAVFFIFVYRPGMLRRGDAKSMIVVCGLLIAIAAVTWQKFSYYYLTGNSDEFDPNVVESYARPALYLGAFMILSDHFLLGSGLGSYASYASQVHYSHTYYEYGLDKVWGLSPQMDSFICDAYYASLAQTGVVGIGLFIWFWVYAYRYVRRYLKVDGPRYRYDFAVGSLMICMMLIECTSGNTFTQPIGQTSMAVLALVCGRAKGLPAAEIEEKEESMI